VDGRDPFRVISIACLRSAACFTSGVCPSAGPQLVKNPKPPVTPSRHLRLSIGTPESLRVLTIAEFRFVGGGPWEIKRTSDQEH
jgi:hypothetical protein